MANLYSSALDRIRASSVTGLTQSQNAYDTGSRDLFRRFFDNTNQWSEASLIMKGDTEARAGALETAGEQLFSGSYINTGNSITEDTATKNYQARERYNEMLAGLKEAQMQRDAEIRARLEDAEFENAGRIADDPSLTTSLANQATSAGTFGGVKATPTTPAQKKAWMGQVAAEKLWMQGRLTGTAWKGVIELLGYDPRPKNMPKKQNAMISQLRFRG